MGKTSAMTLSIIVFETAGGVRLLNAIQFLHLVQGMRIVCSAWDRISVHGVVRDNKQIHVYKDAVVNGVVVQQP